MSHRKGFISYLVVFIASGIFVLLIYFLAHKNPSTVRNQTPVTSIGNKNGPVDNISNGNTITYIKDHNIWIKDSSGERQLTKSGNVGKFKWVAQEKKIAYITFQDLEISQENNRTEIDRVGNSIEILDTKTSQIVAVVSPISFSSNALPPALRDYSIQDFDISSDGEQMAYISNGVWIRNLANGQEQRIASNKEHDLEHGGSNIYYSVQWSPDNTQLLLSSSAWESSITELYTIKTKTIETLSSLYSTDLQWSPDSTSIMGYRSSGMSEGGIWLYDIKTKTTKEISKVPNGSLNVYGATITSTNVIAVMSPMMGVEATDLPTKTLAIYELDKTRTDRKLIRDLQISSNGRFIKDFRLTSTPHVFSYVKTYNQDTSNGGVVVLEIHLLDLQRNIETTVVSNLVENSTLNDKHINVMMSEWDYSVRP